MITPTAVLQSQRERAMGQYVGPFAKEKRLAREVAKKEQEIRDKLFDLAFFSQERVGLGDSTFKMWKIPTMQKGREDLYASLAETHGLDSFGHITRTTSV